MNHIDSSRLPYNINNNKERVKELEEERTILLNRKIDKNSENSCLNFVKVAIMALALTVFASAAGSSVTLLVGFCGLNLIIFGRAKKAWEQKNLDTQIRQVERKLASLREK